MSTHLALLAVLACLSIIDASPKLRRTALISSREPINTEKLVATLNDVVKSVEEEQDAGKKLDKARQEGCKSTLAQLKEAVAEGESTAADAAEDLKGIAADMEAAQVRMSGLSTEIENSNAELDNLQDQLKKLRGSQTQAQSQSQMSLRQVDEVILKMKLGDQEKEVAAVAHQAPRAEEDAPSGANELQHLKELSESLSAARIPLSLIQMELDDGVDLSGSVAALETDRRLVVESSDDAKDAFDKEEKNILELIRTERKKLSKLEQTMQDQRPLLADKLEQIAEMNRTIAGAKRAVKRDSKLLEATEATCVMHSENAKQQIKLRDAQSTLLRMAAKLLENVDSTSLLQRDAASFDALSFVQARARKRSGVRVPQALSDALLSARAAAAAAQDGQDTALLQQAAGAVALAASGAGPFDEVKDMISTLITALKDEANKELNQHQFCQDNLVKNRHERTVKLSDVDRAASELRRAKMAIKRLTEEVAFVESEVARLKVGQQTTATELTEETARVKKQIEQHKLASNIVGQTISVVAQLCGLHEETGAIVEPVLLQAGQRGSNCQEALEMMRQAKAKFKEQNKASEAFISEYERHAGGVKSKMAAAASERELELAEAKSTLASREEAAASAKSDLKAAKKDLELLATAEEEITKSCGPGVETPEARLKRRQEEIDALKNALSVLEGEAVPVSSLVETGVAPGASQDTPEQSF